MSSIVRIDPGTRRVVGAGTLDESILDLGAETVGGHAYLVGGYTGSSYASAVLRYDGRGRTSTVARLPKGIRYAGVAALGGTIYVAGGLTTAGETNAVLAIDPKTGPSPARRPLPHALAEHAAAVWQTSSS